MTQHFNIGDLIHDRYEIVRLINETRENVILECIDNRLDVPSVVKWVKSDDDPVVTENRFRHFLESAKIQAKLNHPNLVHVTNVEATQDTAFIVMDLLHGETLASHIARKPLSPKEILDYLIAVADAVSVGHEVGIAHKSISPYNIILNQQGNKLSPKLLNFATYTVPTRQNPTTLVPFYAPEQLSDNDAADIRADVFSLAATLYYCFTGTVPFSAPEVDDYIDHYLVTKTLTQYPPKIPPAVIPFLVKGLQSDPAQRFSSASEVVSVLRSLIPSMSKVPYPKRTAIQQTKSASQPVVPSPLPTGLTPTYHFIREIGKTDYSCVNIVTYHDNTGEKQACLKYLKDLSTERVTAFNQGISRQQQLAAYSPHIQPVLAHDPVYSAFLTADESRESIEEHVEKHGAIEPIFTLKAFIQIAETLQVCHAFQCLHGGLHPDNIFFVCRNNVTVPLITDFGQHIGMFNETVPFKHLPYMAPELNGKYAANHPQHDIFSFGMCFNFALLGEPIYRSETPEKLMEYIYSNQAVASLSILKPSINADLIRVIDWCTAFNAANRYRNFADVVRDLNAVLKIMGG